jgi:hypothetical protein
MRPIEHRLDVAVHQALKCVEYRLPLNEGFNQKIFELVLGLRYGLVGGASAYYLLQCCPESERETLSFQLQRFPWHVGEHVRDKVVGRLPYLADAAIASRIGELALQPIENCIELFERGCSLEASLSIACQEFGRAQSESIYTGWNPISRRKAVRTYRVAADQSYGYAVCFFERRLADLEEVREIALLGE